MRIQRQHGLEPVHTDHSKSKRRHVVLPKLMNHGVAIDGKAETDKFVELPWQVNLRNVRQNVDVLCKSWSAPEHRR